MERMSKRIVRGAGHATIPTPGSWAVPSPSQRTPIAPGPQQAAVVPDRESRKPDEKQPGEASILPPMQWKTCKATTAPDEQGKAPIGE